MDHKILILGKFNIKFQIKMIYNYEVILKIVIFTLKQNKINYFYYHFCLWKAKIHFRLNQHYKRMFPSIMAPPTSMLNITK